MAQTNHVEGDVGFYLCTDPGDAEYFALMRHPGTIIEFVLSDEAWFELPNEGIVIRPIPRNAQGLPMFMADEVYLPPETFPAFNRLRTQGEIDVRPYPSGE